MAAFGGGGPGGGGQGGKGPWQRGGEQGLPGLIPGFPGAAPGAGGPPPFVQGILHPPGHLPPGHPGAGNPVVTMAGQPVLFSPLLMWLYTYSGFFGDYYSRVLTAH